MEAPSDPAGSGAEGGPDEAPRPAPTDSDTTESARKMQELPREVGVMLMSVGVLGMVLPGMMGVPAVVAGGLVLWPKGFSKVDGWFRRRCPGLHGQGTQQMDRYLDDLERRFPGTKGK